MHQEAALQAALAGVQAVPSIETSDVGRPVGAGRAQRNLRLCHGLRETLQREQDLVRPAKGSPHSGSPI